MNSVRCRRKVDPVVTGRIDPVLRKVVVVKVIVPSKADLREANAAMVNAAPKVIVPATANAAPRATVPVMVDHGLKAKVRAKVSAAPKATVLVMADHALKATLLAMANAAPKVTVLVMAAHGPIAMARLPLADRKAMLQIRKVALLAGRLSKTSSSRISKPGARAVHRTGAGLFALRAAPHRARSSDSF